MERCSAKNVFLKNLQNLQENTCARVPFLINYKPQPATLLRKSLLHRSFPVNFVKFLRTSFSIEHLRWLLLSTFSVGPVLNDGKLTSNIISREDALSISIN